MHPPKENIFPLFYPNLYLPQNSKSSAPLSPLRTVQSIAKQEKPKPRNVYMLPATVPKEILAVSKANLKAH